MRDQRRRRKKTKNKKSALDGILFALMILIAVIGVAVVGVFIGKGMATVTQKDDNTQQQYAQKNTTAPTSDKDQGQEDNEKSDKDDKEETSKIEFNRDYVNILVVGVDEGDLSDEAMMSTRNADSILLVNYYYNENVVNIVSIPRDTVVNQGDEYFNISESLEMGGVKTLIRATEDKLKSDINSYTIVDIDVFKEIVDSLGGVEMVIPYDMKYDDDLQDLHIDFNKNEYKTLMGEDAANFVRWRMNNDGWVLPQNDVSRMEHLQKFLMATIDKIKMTNFTRFGSLGEAIANNVTTDMPIMQVVRYVMSIKDIRISNITYNTVQGVFTKGVDKDKFKFDMDNNREIFRLLNGDGIKNIGRRDLKVKVEYDTSYSNSEELKNKIMALGYNEVQMVAGEVDEISIDISEDLAELSEYILYDFDLKKYKILSPNDPKFDIILRIR